MNSFKVFLAMAFVIFGVLTGPCAFGQEAALKIDTGDTAWVLIC